MMKSKILFIASIPLHFRAFHLPYLEWFKNRGYEVHVACNGYESLPNVDKLWNVQIERSPYNLNNIKAFRELKKIIDSENYVLLHCHTPMASVLTRLAGKTVRKRGAKLLYTAHGFHFFKGASLLNWMLYYPIEISMSYHTDAIICINSEDYNRISQKGNQKCDYYLIPGIGVEKKRFFKIDSLEKENLRLDKGFDIKKFIVVYSAEFIARKNHKFIIEAINQYKNKLNDVLFLFAGKGELQESLMSLTDLYGLNKIVKFIGFRKDIDEIYKLSDLGVSASKQEGLGLNLVEEMMCGLPVVATYDRGHQEVVDDNVNGFLFPQEDKDLFIEKLLELKTDNKKYREFSNNALKKAAVFEISNSLSVMESIYKKYIK